MNKIINCEFFQQSLNQFIQLDKDIIPWKYTCSFNYYYTHNIRIESFRLRLEYDIIAYINIVSIDTKKYHAIINSDEYEYVYNIKKLTTGNIVLTYPVNFIIDFNLFDHRTFMCISNLTYLSLYVSHPGIYNYHLQYMTNLKYLDIGMNSNITNIHLPNLETLYTRNNFKIKATTLAKNNKLKYLQICSIPSVNGYGCLGIKEEEYELLSYIDNIEKYTYIHQRNRPPKFIKSRIILGLKK